ncbi:hypothetical protein BGZ61DRAFT_513039 [Ilyonectria robusta]|uniref:uncharacterized protein n=1 Tax=Ilyonectria robusta TaxID=1079257 RepID=UPI001E8CF1CE|nr:uncharacterized protein BGZ61DRAFT_513039 [Ilyonectria robusta]KAH8735642.1 hypothetical protein BGZ61DRAFT_513039 [Ilyonectria robusta]
MYVIPAQNTIGRFSFPQRTGQQGLKPKPEPHGRRGFPSPTSPVPASIINTTCSQKMDAHFDVDDVRSIYVDENNQRDMQYGLSEEPLIPNVYEPIAQSESLRARSASPRLESGTSFECPYTISQNSDFTKMRVQRRVAENKTKWTGSTQPSNRFHESADFNNHVDRMAVKRRARGSCLSHQRPDADWKPAEPQSRQSSWENWRQAGDRLFGHSSRTRQ